MLIRCQANHLHKCLAGTHLFNWLKGTWLFYLALWKVQQMPLVGWSHGLLIWDKVNVLIYADLSSGIVDLFQCACQTITFVVVITSLLRVWCALFYWFSISSVLGLSRRRHLVTRWPNHMGHFGSRVKLKTMYNVTSHEQLYEIPYIGSIGKESP